MKDLLSSQKSSKEIIDELTPAEQDQQEFVKLRGDMDKVLDQVDQMFKDLDRNISDFNSPGAKAAFTNALSAGLKNRGFDLRVAKKQLDDYQNRV